MYESLLQVNHEIMKDCVAPYTADIEPIIYTNLKRKRSNIWKLKVSIYLHMLPFGHAQYCLDYKSSSIFEKTCILPNDQGCYLYSHIKDMDCNFT